MEQYKAVYEHVKSLIQKNYKKKSLTVDVFYLYLDILKPLSESELISINDKIFDELETKGYKVNRTRKKIYWDVE